MSEPASPLLAQVAPGHWVDPTKVRGVSVRSAWRDAPDRVIVILGGKTGASETMAIPFPSYDEALEAADSLGGGF